MKASSNAHPSNVMEAHQVLMKGGDPDSPPPFKVVQSLRPTGGIRTRLTAKLALRLLGGVAVTKSQPCALAAATHHIGRDIR